MLLHTTFPKPRVRNAQPHRRIWVPCWGQRDALRIPTILRDAERGAGCGETRGRSSGKVLPHTLTSTCQSWRSSRQQLLPQISRVWQLRDLKLLRDFSGHHISKEESAFLHVYLSARAFLRISAHSVANYIFGLVLLDQLLLWSSFSCS